MSPPPHGRRAAGRGTRWSVFLVRVLGCGVPCRWAMNFMKPVGIAICAFGKSKPAGVRIITDHHQLNDFRAENYEIEDDFNRFEATDILWRCGRKMPPSDSGQRWTSALLAHIRLLVSMTQPQDWALGSTTLASITNSDGFLTDFGLLDDLLGGAVSLGFLPKWGL